MLRIVRRGVINSSSYWRSMSSSTQKDKVNVPEGYKYIREGSSDMLLPLNADDKSKSKKNQPVFYNPVQIQNRDLSVLLLNLYAKKRHEEKGGGIRILDALAASGLRSIRYLKEIQHVSEVIINDMDETAVELAKKNMKMNNVDEDTRIRVNCEDAMDYMYKCRENKFDVIDLDPYGSCAPFLDAAVQAVNDGGMLCLTCTDMAVLSGSHFDSCYGRYGSIPMPKGRYLHELALRILLHSLSIRASVYGKVIKPIFSVGMAFYIRVFVEVYKNKAEVLRACSKSGYVYQSTQCPSFYTVPMTIKKGNKHVPCRGPPVEKCESTGSQFKVGGPVWLDPIHCSKTVSKAISTLETEPEKWNFISTKTPIHGLLTAVSEELNDVPLYYTLSDLCHTLHCQVPPLQKMYSAILNAGYRVSAQHKEPGAIKTDAPPNIIWDIMRSWVQLHPVSSKWITGTNSTSTAAKILSQESTTEIDWTYVKQNHKKKAQRFPMNPEKHWGPKPRAVGKRSHSNNNNNQQPQKVAKTQEEDSNSKNSNNTDNEQKEHNDTKIQQQKEDSKNNS